MTKKVDQKRGSASEPNTRYRGQPHRVRLPGFIVDEEIGLGDFIKKATYSIGIRPCGGCEQRAAVLNRWVIISRAK